VGAIMRGRENSSLSPCQTMKSWVVPYLLDRAFGLVRLDLAASTLLPLVQWSLIDA
jgi:hypothetical protein